MSNRVTNNEIGILVERVNNALERHESNERVIVNGRYGYQAIDAHYTSDPYGQSRVVQTGLTKREVYSHLQAMLTVLSMVGTAVK